MSELRHVIHDGPCLSYGDSHSCDNKATSGELFCSGCGTNPTALIVITESGQKVAYLDGYRDTETIQFEIGGKTYGLWLKRLDEQEQEIQPPELASDSFSDSLVRGIQWLIEERHFVLRGTGAEIVSALLRTVDDDAARDPRFPVTDSNACLLMHQLVPFLDAVGIQSHLRYGIYTLTPAPEQDDVCADVCAESRPEAPF